MGGVYLDTDVIIRKSFDDLLDVEAFIGFSCDCALSTTVIGARKESPFIKGIMEMYDTGRFYTEAPYQKGTKQTAYCDGKWAPSNEYWTWYLICTHSYLALNNETQRFSDVTVYPKHYFELGNLTAS